MHIDGFHGTDKESTSNICKNGIDENVFEIKNTEKWPNDLGAGFYCYVSANDSSFLSPYTNAFKYAKTFRCKREENISILKIGVEVDDKNILNLTIQKNLIKIHKLLDQVARASYDGIIKQHPNLIKQHAAQRGNRDGFEINYIILHRLITAPSLVLMDTTTDFDHIRSNFHNGREMCIKDKSIINSLTVLK